MKEQFLTNKKVESSENESESSSRGISRREFLLAGGVGLLAMMYPKDVLAKLQDILDYEKPEPKDYERGIYELHDQVFKNDKEIRRFYLKAKNEFEIGKVFKKKTKSCWYEGRGTKQSDRAVFSNKKSYDVLLDDPEDLEDIRIIHTHPQEAEKNMRARLEAEGIKMDAEMVRPLAPSSVDIYNAIRLTYLYPKSQDKLSEEVVDSTGVWNIKIKTDHPKIKELFENMKRTEQGVKNLSEEDRAGAKRDIAGIIRKNAGIDYKEENVTDEMVVDFETRETQLMKMASATVDDCQRKIFISDRASRLSEIEITKQMLTKFGIELNYRALI